VGGITSVSVDIIAPYSIVVPEEISETFSTRHSNMQQPGTPPANVIAVLRLIVSSRCGVHKEFWDADRVTGNAR
jgi:hypothetical protein